MLDRDNHAQPIADSIHSLPCHVKLPAQWQETFEKMGPAPTSAQDTRRFSRFYCRGSQGRAALEYRQSLPALPRKYGWYGVYTMDISRGSLGFLHSEPLYPGERMRVMMSNGRHQVVEVVRCCRIGDQCFQIGSRFVSDHAGGTEENP